MTTVLVSICVIVAAAVLFACGRSPKLPITGEINLEFIRVDESDIRFKLRNQMTKEVSFVGARNWCWEPVFPQGPVFKCALVDPDRMYESPFPLIDGPNWDEFTIGSGEEIDIVVSSFFLRDSDGRVPAGRCRLVLPDVGGDALESEEFKSLTSWSS